MSTYTLKIETLYLTCSPGLGLVSYGVCQDEALNNRHDELERVQRPLKEGAPAKKRPPR